jgi:cytochrome P450
MLDTWSAARYLANPYSYYAWLRAIDPVHWNSALQLWTLTRRADVVTELTHPSLSSRRPQPKLDDPAVRSVHDSLAAWLLRSDPPVHTRLRALATRGLHAHVVGMQHRIRAQAEQLVDAAQPRRGAVWR